jgi:hypothetical protein
MNKKSENFSRYNKLIALSLTIYSGLFVLLMFLMEAQKMLIAPPFISSLSFDEKLRYFREIKPKNSQILAVGSSMTLNNMDSTLIKDRNGRQISTVNFASWGSQISDLQPVTDFSIKLIAKPNIVLILSSPVDFRNCSSPTTTNRKYVSFEDFNETDGLNYISSNIPALYYHFKYRDLFNAVNLTNVLNVRQKRNNNDTYDSLKFDSGGSIVLEVPKENILPSRWEGSFWKSISISDICYQSLEKFASNLVQNNINLVFVLTPMREAYLNKYDPSREIITSHRARLTSILKKYNGLLIDARNDLPLTDEYFADALHLNKKGAQLLTRYISEKLNQKFSAP